MKKLYNRTILLPPESCLFKQNLRIPSKSLSFATIPSTLPSLYKHLRYSTVQSKRHVVEAERESGGEEEQVQGGGGCR